MSFYICFDTTRPLQGTRVVETATFHPIFQGKYSTTRCPDPATLFNKPLFCCLWVSCTSLSLLPSLHRARLALLDSLTLVELSLPLSGHRNPVAVSSRFSFLLCSSCKGLAVFPGPEKHWYTLTGSHWYVSCSLTGPRVA